MGETKPTEFEAWLRIEMTERIRGRRDSETATSTKEMRLSRVMCSNPPPANTRKKVEDQAVVNAVGCQDINPRMILDI